MLIGVFFIASLQLVFLGILGEYVGAIYTQVQKRPYTVELERVNFPLAKDAPPTLAHSYPAHSDSNASRDTREPMQASYSNASPPDMAGSHVSGTDVR